MSMTCSLETAHMHSISSSRAFHTADAGSVLLRVIVALALGAVLLATITQAVLSQWHYAAAIAAVEQADQRAMSVITELAATLAGADGLPDTVQWSLSHDSAVALTVASAVVEGGDRYLWDSSGVVYVQRIGHSGRERLVGGISSLQWQPDVSRQGGWLRVEAVSDVQAIPLPLYYRRGCHANERQACRFIARYIAHPVLPLDAVTDGGS